MFARAYTYEPTLTALADRDFSRFSLPPHAWNELATIERATVELHGYFESVASDLRQIISAVEKLSPRTLPLFEANAQRYRETISLYQHSADGVRSAFGRLCRSVKAVAAVLGSQRETYEPPRLPAEEPPALEVEMS